MIGDSETGTRDPYGTTPEPGSDDRAVPFDPVPAAAADDAPPAAAAAHDGPDVPADPDDRTLAAAAAAQGAEHYASSARRPYRGPRSILTLVLVIAAVVGLGVYAVEWADRLRLKNERIELRELGRRHVMSQVQQRNKVLKFGPDSDVQPAGFVYRPLAPAERARYDALAARHPPQFKPNELERGLIDETDRLQAAREPATAPSG